MEAGRLPGGSESLATEAVTGTITDFGGVVHASPSAVVEARSAEGVMEAFEMARRSGVQIVSRGAEHSCGGQSLIEGGVHLRPRFDSEPTWIDDEVIELPAGLNWAQAEAAARSRGRAIPIVPSVLEPTVAGTLSVGCYGTSSPRFGAQIDYVTGLELISPDGGVRWCSPEEEPRLFRNVLAGLGQLGVMTRARIRTVPYLPHARTHGYRFGSLSDMARAIGFLGDPSVTAPPYIRAFSYKPERPGIVLFGSLTREEAELEGELPARAREDLARVHEELGEPATEMPAPNARDLEAEFDANWVERYPGHLRLWIDYGFGYESYLAYCAELERMASEGAFGKAIRAVYVAVVPTPVRGSDYFPFDIRPRGVERTFTCGVYCMVPSGDAALLAQVRTALRRCQDLMIELGGRPYIYGFNQVSAMDWRRAFGEEAVEGLMSLRAELDPEGLIPPAWDRIPRASDSDEAAALGPRFVPGSGERDR